MQKKVMQVLFCDLHSAIVLADNVWSSRQNYRPCVMVYWFWRPILLGNSTTPTKVGRFCRSSDIGFSCMAPPCERCRVTLTPGLRVRLVFAPLCPPHSGTPLTQQHQILSRNTRDKAIIWWKLKVSISPGLETVSGRDTRTDGQTDRQTDRQNYHS